MKLIKEIVGQEGTATDQGDPVQQTGIEYDVINQEWEKAGRPRSAEAVYALLAKLFKNRKFPNHEAMIRSGFKEIGMNLQQTKKKAKDVLPPDQSKYIITQGKQYRPDHIQWLIDKIRTGVQA